MSDSLTVDLDYDWRATFSHEGPWCIVHLHPSDQPFGDVIGLVKPLWEELERRWATLVVVEMDEVQFLGSSMMGELVRLYKRIAQRQGAMRLCGLREECRDALHVCRLDEVLHSAPTRDMAIHSHL